MIEGLLVGTRRSNRAGAALAALVLAASCVFALAGPASARSVRITLTVSPAAASVGTTVRLAGTVQRAPRGTRVVVQEQAGTAWAVVAKTKTGKHGTFGVATVATTSGAHTYRAVAKLGRKKLTSQPASLSVTAPTPSTPAKPGPPATPTPIDRLTLASPSTTGTGGNRDSSGSSISADGRYIAFTSAATNLVPGDTLGHLDVFLRDTVAGTTTLISHTPTGGFPEADSYSPSISGNGRFVAFTSYAHDVVVTWMPTGENVYVWDRNTGAIRAALPGYATTTNSPSMSSTGTVVVVADTTPHTIVIGGADGNPVWWAGADPLFPSYPDHDEERPQISDDGSTFVFDSSASNLTTTSGSWNNVYLVRMSTPGPTAGPVIQLSKPASGGAPTMDSFRPTITADGHYVTYETSAGNLATGTGTGHYEIVVTDTVTGQTSLVSSAPGGSAADANAYAPVISADGSMVAYFTKATNLAAGISSAHYDVVVQPRAGGAARVVSSTLSGALGNSDSVTPSISGDGRYVAFHSKATNFVAADTDPTYDIYRWDALGNR